MKGFFGVYTLSVAAVLCKNYPSIWPILRKPEPSAGAGTSTQKGTGEPGSAAGPLPCGIIRRGSVRLTAGVRAVEIGSWEIATAAVRRRCVGARRMPGRIGRVGDSASGRMSRSMKARRRQERGLGGTSHAGAGGLVSCRVRSRRRGGWSRWLRPAGRDVDNRQ